MQLKKHPLARFGLWALYMAVFWGLDLLLAQILDARLESRNGAFTGRDGGPSHQSGAPRAVTGRPALTVARAPARLRSGRQRTASAAAFSFGTSQQRCWRNDPEPVKGCSIERAKVHISSNFRPASVGAPSRVTYM